MVAVQHQAVLVFFFRCTPIAGGSQGDIYAIKKTVEELNAIYQVW
jgi:hypothetical protein